MSLTEEYLKVGNQSILFSYLCRNILCELVYLPKESQRSQSVVISYAVQALVISVADSGLSQGPDISGRDLLSVSIYGIPYPWYPPLQSKLLGLPTRL